MKSEEEVIRLCKMIEESGEGTNARSLVGAILDQDVDFEDQWVLIGITGERDYSDPWFRLHKRELDAKGYDNSSLVFYSRKRNRVREWTGGEWVVEYTPSKGNRDKILEKYFSKH